MSDIKTTTESAAESTAESLSKAAEAVEQNIVDPARAAMEQAVQRGEEFARQQGEQVKDWIVREPLAAVGAAFGLGVLITLFIRLKMD